MTIRGEHVKGFEGDNWNFLGPNARKHWELEKAKRKEPKKRMTFKARFVHLLKK